MDKGETIRSQSYEGIFGYRLNEASVDRNREIRLKLKTKKCEDKAAKQSRPYILRFSAYTPRLSDPQRTIL